MNLKNFMDGLSILSKHYTRDNPFCLGAEHDQVYVYATDTHLSQKEVTTLIELGWFQPGVGEGEEYNPEESWSAFV